MWPRPGHLHTRGSQQLLVVSNSSYRLWTGLKTSWVSPPHHEIYPCRKTYDKTVSVPTVLVDGLCIHYYMDHPLNACRDGVSIPLGRVWSSYIRVSGDVNYWNAVHVISVLSRFTGAVNRTPSVKRVVLTASIATLAHSVYDKPAGYIFTENDWNEKSTPMNLPYYCSKTLAEKKAWEMCKAQDRWTLVTIHPSLVLGPPMTSRRDGVCVHVMMDLFKVEQIHTSSTAEHMGSCWMWWKHHFHVVLVFHVVENHFRIIGNGLERYPPGHAVCKHTCKTIDETARAWLASHMIQQSLCTAVCDDVLHRTSTQAHQASLVAR